MKDYCPFFSLKIEATIVTQRDEVKHPLYFGQFVPSPFCSSRTGARACSEPKIYQPEYRFSHSGWSQAYFIHVTFRLNFSQL